MDFANPVDQRVRLKEIENKDKYPVLSGQLKKKNCGT